MDAEAKEVLRAFLRRWSTTDLTPSTRRLLDEDYVRVRCYLDIFELSAVLDGALDASDRSWFAQKLNELRE